MNDSVMMKVWCRDGGFVYCFRARATRPRSNRMTEIAKSGEYSVMLHYVRIYHVEFM